MTRQEEINNKWNALSFQSNHKYDERTFKEAVEWADKTMEERVLNFIHTYFYEHPHVNCHICADSFESLEEMESELIKTMEE